MVGNCEILVVWVAFVEEAIEWELVRMIID